MTPGELRILDALRKLGEADRIAVGSETGHGSQMADYLCRYLSAKGLVRTVGRRKGRTRYAITPKGLAILGWR